VTDSAGHAIRGLGAADFKLFDNDRPQLFHLDDTGEKYSIVIAVQTNTAVRAWLGHVRRIGNVVESLLAGAQGDVTVISFNDEVKIVPQWKDLQASGDKSRCLDAIAQAVGVLKRTPVDRRRILLLIAQAGDNGSSAILRDLLRDLGWNNVAVYSMVMPRVGKDLLGNVRIGGVQDQGGGFVVTADLRQLAPEIDRGAKSAWGEDAVTAVTDHSGGRRIPFRDLRQLEAGISAIGEELHTGYMLSYAPDQPAAGYHRIRVETPGRPAAMRARPGYYVADE
jgi:hypothetical protein